jgi:hypothetical protein
MAEALEVFLSSLPEPISAARLALYTRELFRKEVQQGPVLERPFNGAELQSQLFLPPPPRSLLGGAEPRMGGPLPVPAPFATRASIPLAAPPISAEPPDLTLPEGDAELESSIDFEPLELTHPFLSSRTPSHGSGRVAFFPPPGNSSLRAVRELELDASRARSPAFVSHGEEERSLAEARPLARTLSMPVVQSMRRIVITVLPAAMVLLASLYGVSRFLGESPAEAPSSRPAASAIERSAVAEPTPQRPRQSTSMRFEAPMAAPPTAQTPATQGNVLLSVDSHPWSTVYMGDRLLGTTPVIRVVVPDGPLTLRLVDADGRVHERRLDRSRDPAREVFFELVAR